MEKNVLGRLILKLALTLGLFMALGVGTVFAAVNDYTVSGGNPGALGTVGDAAVAVPTITITDTGGDDFGNADENIVIDINTTNYNNVEFDSSIGVGSLTMGGTCPRTADTATYANSDQRVTVNLNTASCTAGQTITIGGLKVKTIYAASAPGAQALLNVDNATTAAGSPVSTSSTINLAVTVAGDAVTLGALALGANSVVGTAGNTTLTLTISHALANTDTVVFTMPVWTDVPEGAFTGESETFGGAGTFNCTAVDATRVVTCTADGVINAGTATIVLPETTALYVSTGANAITDLTVNRVANSGGGGDINTDATVTITTTTVGDLTTPNVTPESLSLSTISPTTFTFVTTASIPASAKIVIVYPAGWNLAGAAGQVASGLSGLSGSWTASVSGQTLTLTGGTSTGVGTKTFTLNGIMTPPNEGSGGTYSITTTTSADANIETDAAVAADTIIGKVASSIVVGAVTAVAVTDNTGGGVLITWIDPTGSSDATKDIKIMKGTAPLPVDGGQYALVLKGVQKYVDTNVKTGDVVTYQLRASNGSGETGTTAAPVSFTVGSSVKAETEVKKEETPAPETLTVTLSAQNSSGEIGTATITEVAGKAKVVLALTGFTKDLSQPAHIHMGSCATPGEVKYTLTSALNGASETTLDVSLAALKAGVPLMINVHKSVADVAIYSACGDILPAAAAEEEVSEEDEEADELDEEDLEEDEEADEEDDEEMDEDEKEVVSVKLSDIATHWAKKEVEAMVAKGVIKGHKDGSFKPNDFLNRAEAAILLCRVLDIDETVKAKANPFKDVVKDSWYGGCVEELKALMVVKGNPDGTYKPSSNINRAEFLALVMRAYGEMLDEDEKADLDAMMTGEAKASFVDVDAKNAWYANIAYASKEMGFVMGRECGKDKKDKCFDGGTNITRAEAATVLFRVFDELL